MGRSGLLLSAIALLFISAAAWAQTPRQATKPSDPLVRALEALYAKSMDIASTGDLDAYWKLRTVASRDRPPRLTPQLLPLFAQMLPPLSTLRFVRMDNTGGMARALYRWPREDVVRYTVIVYRVEDKEWKIDSVLVKTDVRQEARESEFTEQVKQRSQAARHGN